MADDFIRRSEAVEFVKNNTPSFGDTTTMQCVERSLANVPAADVVEVVHAYWKETTHITKSKRGREIHSKLYNCSNCDAPNGRKKNSYCHWCGAKMDGERKKANEQVDI